LCDRQEGIETAWCAVYTCVWCVFVVIKRRITLSKYTVGVVRGRGARHIETMTSLLFELRGDKREPFCYLFYCRNGKSKTVQSINKKSNKSKMKNKEAHLLST